MTIDTDQISVPSSATTDRFIVVSSDTHVGPSVAKDLHPYCETRHLEIFDEYVEELAEHNTLESQRPHVVSLFGAHDRAQYPEEFLDRRFKYSRIPGVSDPHARLRDMDADGIAAEVIYHGALNGEAVPFSSTGLRAWSSHKYDEYEAVGVRIYNRWLADFVSVEPERHVGTAHIPIHDVTEAVREIEWAASAGLKAINLPAPRTDFLSYLDLSWEPVWAASASNGIVMNSHAGGGQTFEYPAVPAAAAMYFVENPFLSRRALYMLVFGGVFARYPDLRLVLTEQSCDWVPEAISDLDSTYYCYHNVGLRHDLPEPAGQYFLKNCSIGASFMARHEMEMAIDRNLVDRFMWGSDYPHPEGTWPRTLDSMRKSFGGIDSGPVRNVLGGNAIDVYGLDKATLSAVAARIGPSREDLDGQSSVPAQRDGYAFRSIGKWA
jgi:predicted TIM-barrel fold metal-dependent hydrolase